MTGRRGQADLLTAALLVGVALTIGAAMVAYFTAATSTYREEISIANLLAYEASNTFINIVSYDSRSLNLWLVLKRLDGGSSNFFIAVDNSTSYLPCTQISYYNPRYDEDGVLCNSTDECPTSATVYLGPLSKVYVLWEGALVDFLSYARASEYPTAEPMYVCSVANVCQLEDSTGLCGRVTLVRIALPKAVPAVRVYLVTLIGGSPYVFGVYEVLLQ